MPCFSCVTWGDISNGIANENGSLAPTIITTLVAGVIILFLFGLTWHIEVTEDERIMLGILALER